MGCTEGTTIGSRREDNGRFTHFRRACDCAPRVASRSAGLAAARHQPTAIPVTGSSPSHTATLSFLSTPYTVYDMHMKCSICFDALGPDALPVATRCGHLYCLDCATFNFSRGDATCAICRAPHALKKLVKLFPDYEQESQAAEPTNGRNTSSGAPGAQDADVWDESTLVDIALGRWVYAIGRLLFSNALSQS